MGYEYGQATRRKNQNWSVKLLVRARNEYVYRTCETLWN